MVTQSVIVIVLIVLAIIFGIKGFVKLVKGAIVAVIVVVISFTLYNQFTDDAIPKNGLFLNSNDKAFMYSDTDELYDFVTYSIVPTVYTTKINLNGNWIGLNEISDIYIEKRVLKVRVDEKVYAIENRPMRKFLVSVFNVV